MIVFDRQQLKQLVAKYERYDSFVVDLETIYTPTPEEVERLARVEATSPSARTIDDKKWLEAFKLKATDVIDNEVIWFGLSTFGTADSVPCGHPNGDMLKPPRKEKIPAFELFGPDDPRSYTANGKPSMRGITRAMPAVFAPPPEQLSIGEVLDELWPLFMSGRAIVNQNLKFDLKTLYKYTGEFPQGPLRDTLVEQHLLNENLKAYDLGALIKRHFHHEYDKLGKKGVQNFSFGKAALYAQQDARLTWLLDRKLMRLINRNPTFAALFAFEMEAYAAFMEMEHEGICVDEMMMRDLRRQREAAIAQIREQLIVDFDVRQDFNPNADSQVRDLLYVKYKAPVTRLTDGGKDGANKQPSTDAVALEQIVESESEAAPVAKLLLEHAEQDKILGTYLIGMSNKIHDGRVRPDFKMHGTVTGRPSCSEPNLQNIPRESEMREMFHAPPGFVLVVGDYDQIELRFIAEYAHDRAMISIFNSDEDIHSATASKVLGRPVGHDDPERTTHGKMPNFLIGYGGTAKLLAAKTGITVPAAESVFASYFRQFKDINPWKERVLRDARKKAVVEDGRVRIPPYVETMMGRRRRLENLLLDPDRADSKRERSRLWGLRAEAERQGVNAIIQGSAAEVTKLAMIDVKSFVAAQGFPMKTVLMVHDEIVTVVPKQHGEEAKQILTDLMQDVVLPTTGERPLKAIKLVASVGVMERWKKG